MAIDKAIDAIDIIKYRLKGRGAATHKVFIFIAILITQRDKTDGTKPCDLIMLDFQNVSLLAKIFH